ncbi:unnamed protein product [Dimorphilus gyrociliatus]|uniref:Uncharacterized protein n=1 Tax=Dimorphilus gyrociliatus TaxID=2664684 RepID=A0A7I8VQG6_9ANNE|nr:unnamed protein product [Dimorphilus gyrociliatus]
MEKLTPRSRRKGALPQGNLVVDESIRKSELEEDSLPSERCIDRTPLSPKPEILTDLDLSDEENGKVKPVAVCHLPRSAVKTLTETNEIQQAVKTANDSTSILIDVEVHETGENDTNTKALVVRESSSSVKVIANGCKTETNLFSVIEELHASDASMEANRTAPVIVNEKLATKPKIKSSTPSTDSRKKVGTRQKSTPIMAKKFSSPIQRSTPQRLQRSESEDKSKAIKKKGKVVSSRYRTPLVGTERVANNTISSLRSKPKSASLTEMPRSTKNPVIVSSERIPSKRVGTSTPNTSSAQFNISDTSAILDCNFDVSELSKIHSISDQSKNQDEVSQIELDLIYHRYLQIVYLLEKCKCSFESQERQAMAQLDTLFLMVEEKNERLYQLRTEVENLKSYNLVQKSVQSQLKSLATVDNLITKATDQLNTMEECLEKSANQIHTKEVIIPNDQENFHKNITKCLLQMEETLEDIERITKPIAAEFCKRLSCCYGHVVDRVQNDRKVSLECQILLDNLSDTCQQELSLRAQALL